MVKEENNKETGVEKTPVLTEDKSADNKSVKSKEEVANKITPKEIAELQAKNAELEKSNKEKDAKISELEDVVEKQKKTIAESQKIVDAQKEIISDKDALIVEGKNLIEEQKEDIVRLLKEQLPNSTGASPKEGEVVIRFLLSPAGRYKLPYNVGQEVALHKEVAAEIVEARYAEYVLGEE